MNTAETVEHVIKAWKGSKKTEKGLRSALANALTKHTPDGGSEGSDDTGQLGIVLVKLDSAFGKHGDATDPEHNASCWGCELRASIRNDR